MGNDFLLQEKYKKYSDFNFVFDLSQIIQQLYTNKYILLSIHQNCSKKIGLSKKKFSLYKNP